MKLPAVATRLAPLIEAGLVATTAQLDAEALYSARSPAEYEQLRRIGDWRSSICRRATSTGRARWVRSGSWPRAAVTAPWVADLLIATVAAAHDVLLIHYDSDFEISADVITVRHQWVVDRGTVD